MRSNLVLGLCGTAILAIGFAACDDDSSNGAPSTSSASAGGGATTTSASGGNGSGGTTTSGGGRGGSTASSGAGGGDDIPGGGTVLFSESFDDNSFGNRGWYDGPAGDISTSEAFMGGAFECHFTNGATSCSAGKPARHKFTDSESVYMSFYLKFSSNWVGSGLPYHPHMFHFITNLDSDYVGPANSHLTTYQEVVEGRALLALQDSSNVDNNCILRNNDTFVGCNGDFNSYVFSENRSVAACNGIVGDLDGRDCFDNGYWYSSRLWRSSGAVFNDANWHHIEVYYEMNSIMGGIGVADGKIRWVQDGQTLISYDAVLMRTGANPNAAFNQFAMLPYIGAGSPIDQRYWVDELIVATARP